MKLSQKKTCNGCKSLDYHGDRCALNVSIKTIGEPDKILILKRHKPIGLCYKPRTNNELAFLLKNVRNK